MSIRLDGTNPLSYMGVTPVSPPQFEVHNRAPTANDTQNFNLGTIWLERDTENFWILSSLTGGVAIWTPFSNGADTFNTDVGGPVIPLNGVVNVLGEAGTIVTVGAANTIFIGAGTTLATTYETDAGNAVPAANILKIVGGPNINTDGAANIVTVNLNNSIILPATTADELSGVISIGAGSFIHAYGTDNAFFGLDAGNFTLTTALRNSALGKQALLALTTGDDNNAIGAAALTSLTTGSRNFAAGNGALGLATSASDNLAIGHLALDNLLTGTANICIGEDAGDAYVAAESSNILISNDGIAAESNTIRIGTDGSGVGEQNRTFIAGIEGVNVGSVAKVTTINAGQLGSATLTAGSNVTITPTANTITIAATSSGGVAGTLSFLAALSAFSALNNGTLTALGAAVALTTIYDNSGGAFNPGNGAGTAASFTAPATGVYVFNMYYDFGNYPLNAQVTCYTTVNAGVNYPWMGGGLYPITFDIGGGNMSVTVTGSVQLALTVGDVVQFCATMGGAGASWIGNAIQPYNYTSVAGYRLA